MVLNIIFSYNRAMQLEYLLKSILQRFKFNYKTVIIYHTTGDHRNSYNLLKKKYQGFNHIEFIERKELFFDITYFPSLFSKSNIKFFIEKNLRAKHGDNFKALVHHTIQNSNCDFVMFNTDDGFFFEDVLIPDEVFNLIYANPEGASFRLYVGDNLSGVPSFLKRNESYYEWNYYEESIIHHWTFPFSVDGTIYNSAGINKHLKKVVFNNPVYLEINGEQYVRKNKLFGIGLSPIESKLVQTKLNRVSLDTKNPTIHIQPDFLHEKFMDGYSLKLTLPNFIDNANLVPQEVSLVKDFSEEVIYNLDEHGNAVQNLLGIEGAKKQMD